MALQIQKSFDQEENQWNIFPAGEVDIATAPAFRVALDEAFREKPGNMTLHFDDLGYMDSTGLGVIIGAYGRMKENGYRIVLSNPQENIQKLLHITSLDKIFCPDNCEK
ncbi:MAG: STAS domain-containing protein [Eubacteriales bacterium]|nr:STAS domain-containing protein [Eubacteriales bacterium]MDD3350675.1 STAS domain-containing protein [Eubacteriales bacterium]